MARMPEKLVQETKGIIGLYQFLYCDCGLKYTNKLSAEELKLLLYSIKTEEKG